MPSSQNNNAGLMIVVFGLAAIWRLWSMASATEAPGAAVSTLEILFLVGILIGLVGSIVKYFGAATDDRK